MRQFEELRIWKDSRIFVSKIYFITSESNDFSFNDQIKRAAISVMNNIAEGNDSGSDSMFIRFLNIAKASCSEVKSMLYLAEDLKICSTEQAENLRQESKNLSAGIFKLIDYLKKNNKSATSQLSID
jgi:four helix bundle protein